VRCVGGRHRKAAAREAKANPRENPHQNQGCGTRKPERRQNEEKSLNPEGASYKGRLAH